MMPRNNLPSVDDPVTQPAPKPAPQPAEDSGPPITQPIGYASRHIDVRMTAVQAVRFKRICRHLDETGAQLEDGTPVTNKRRAALWLLENFVLPE